MMIKLILGITYIMYVWIMTSSSSSYFKRTYGKETRQGLVEEFFQCDQEESCTNVIKTQKGDFETVKEEKELAKRKDISGIWKKMKIGQETSGKVFCLFFVIVTECRENREYTYLKCSKLSFGCNFCAQ